MLALTRFAPTLLLTLLFINTQALADAEQPAVVTSLKPLELLVRAVAHDQVTVTTLVPAGSSPHTYQLRPSERRQLADASLVFWVGPQLETFLSRLLSGPDFSDRTVALAPGEAAAEEHGHEEHGHDDHGADAHSDHDQHEDAHGHDHAHEGEDPHVWLDPALALEMAGTIARVLKELDGVDADVIDANLAAFARDLSALESSIKQQLAPARTLDLFTYHDAFRRFAGHYGLEISGVLTLSPERTPGARHLADVQQRLRQAKQACLMIEPQFDRQWWQSLMNDVKLPISEWDPLASDVPATPQGYLLFQQGMADAVLDCLPQRAQ